MCCRIPGAKTVPPHPMGHTDKAVPWFWRNPVRAEQTGALSAPLVLTLTGMMQHDLLREPGVDLKCSAVSSSRTHAENVQKQADAGLMDKRGKAASSQMLISRGTAKIGQTLRGFLDQLQGNTPQEQT